MKNEKLDEMRKGYEEIRIPKDLRKNVEEAIESAKKDGINEKEGNIMKGMGKKEMGTSENKQEKVFLYLKRSAVAAAVILGTITIAANSSATVAHAMEEIPIIGAITRVVTFRNYESTENENKMTADIRVPKVEEISQGGGEIEQTEKAKEELNKSVEEYTNELIVQYEEDLKRAKEENAEYHEAVFSDYEVITDNEELFTLRINTTISTGGSINLSKLYHMDKRNGEIITLNNLFVENSNYVEVISEDIKQQMKTIMAEDEGKSYFIDSDTPEFDFKQIKGDQNFYVNSQGNLTLVFDEYEVAPGYMGVVEFELNKDILKDIIREDSIIK